MDQYDVDLIEFSSSVGAFETDTGFGIYVLDLENYNFYSLTDVTISDATISQSVNPLFDTYTAAFFTTDTNFKILVGEEDFGSYFKQDITSRSGLCADVSTVFAYNYRAYNTNLGSYIFWTSGLLDPTGQYSTYPTTDLKDVAIVNTI